MRISFHELSNRVYEASIPILNRDDEISLNQFRQRLDKIRKECSEIKLVLKKSPVLSVSVTPVNDIKDILDVLRDYRRYFGSKITIVYLVFNTNDNKPLYATFSKLDENTKTAKDIAIKTVKQSEILKVRTKWGLGKSEEYTGKQESGESNEDVSERRRFMGASDDYDESYDLMFEDAMADKLKDLLGDDYYTNTYVPFKNKIASKVKVGEDEDGKPIMGENPDLKLKQPKYLLDTYSDNPQELKDLIDNYKTKRATITQKKIDGAEKIGENSDYVCYRITTYPAAQYYGSNTTWCITGRYKGNEEKGEEYFNKYIRDKKLDGGYYFFIHKTNPRRKYALLQQVDKKDKKHPLKIYTIWSALNSQLTMDKVPVFPLVKEIPELKNIYKDIDVENTQNIKDRDKKSLEHDILISCMLPEENVRDSIRNIKEILDGDAYKDYKFDLNTIKDENGKTLLYIACENNNKEIIKLLLARGADVNIQSEDGETPLSIVCRNNNPEIIKLLLVHGADVNIRNENGYTPLSRVCYNNNLEIVKLLLAHGAYKSINTQDDEFGYTPLYIACERNYPEIVKILLAHGADVNIKSKDGYTPLYMACVNANTEIVKILLEHGADVNIRNENGYTPLYLACLNANTEVARLLLEYGAWKDLDADNLPKYISRNSRIEDLVLSYLNKNRRNESIRLRRLYRR